MSARIMPKRAVIYTRVSRDDTGEGQSNDRQAKACQQLCDMRGWVVVREPIRDIAMSGYSGKGRNGWTEVMRMIEAGEADVVVAWHIDRMTRNMADLEKLIDIAEKQGVGVATVSGDIDLTTDVGRMVARILGAVARAEVERKAARTRLKNEQKASQGLPHLGGPRPFGYQEDWMGTIPAEADAIRLGAKMALAGETYAAIAQLWSSKGLNPPRGFGKDWTSEGVQNCLTNARNAAIRVYNGKQVGPAAWEPILDLDTYLRLTEIDRSPNRSANSGRTGRAPQNVLVGAFECGKCEGPVIASTKPRRGELRKTYACKAGHVFIERDIAENFIEGAAVARLSRPDAANLFSDDEPEDQQAVQAEITKLNDRLKMMSRMLGAGTMEQEDYEDAAGVARGLLRDAQNRLRTRTAPDFEGLSLGTGAVASQWKELSMARRRTIIRLLFDIKLMPVGQGRRIDRGEIDAKDRFVITDLEPART
ncbi:Site-specific DNA recombinase [Promicromonospora umidemergens]|uniref:Recombinase family protein n=1 Tax=Promicromonospora umidemergens TaxID=629679 RepID=A0ABP8YHB5_9MICO|nr:recombinase family protein [Promicromonospora umidemergens]MCP2286626.1 Site-specific DNA recombinase [Promicromonospora umidemergens]